MLRLLKTAADSKEHTKREVLSEFAKHFGLTESERKLLLPSGNQAIFDNRLGWARTCLKKARGK
jgi:restriction system protein